MFQCIYKITILWIKAVSICCVVGQHLPPAPNGGCRTVPGMPSIISPERSHSILKQMRCTVKSLRMTSAVQTPQLLRSQFPFLMECWSSQQSSQWRWAEHGPCSDRGRHCSKENAETCDYALTAVLPACWTAGIFLFFCFSYLRITAMSL